MALRPFFETSPSINPGEKVGLIGTNGSGKTTLLKILANTQEPDEGTVSRRNGLTTGTLEQIPDFHESTTVLDEALRSFAGLITAEKELADLEHEMQFTPTRSFWTGTPHCNTSLSTRGYRFRSMAEAAVLGIGFTRPMLSRETGRSPVAKESAALAKLLLRSRSAASRRPTNHLDIRSIEWLEKFLKDTAKTIMVVSHDRIFLDRVVNSHPQIDNSN
jgi:ATP-binding cassette subfamily F protein 3